MKCKRLAACAGLIFAFILFRMPAAAAPVEVIDRQITLSLSEGEREGFYTGTLENEVPHGYGIFNSQNNEGLKWTYTGEFVNGLMEGQGRTDWGNGVWHEGGYKAGRFEGEGIYSPVEGIEYSSVWTAGVMTGEVQILQNGETVYEGPAIDYGGLSSMFDWEDWMENTYDFGIDNITRSTTNIFSLFSSGAGLIVAGVIILLVVQHNKKKKNQNLHTAQVNTQYAPKVPVSVKCKCCGAPGQFLPGTPSECEYCGSALSE